MKKFISWGVAIATLFFLSGCREVEDFPEFQKVDYNTLTKIKEDSLNSKIELVDDPKFSDEKQDPPKKDEIRW